MNEISSYEEYRNYKNDESCEIKGFARYGCYKGLDFFEELNENKKLREITNVEAFEDCLVFIKTHIIELEEENSQLQQERDKYKSIVEKAIEYIKHSWWLRFDQIYDTSKDLQGWEVEQLFEILNKIKELEEGNSNE